MLLVGDNYIKSIPKQLLNLCNKSNFPIFIIPWSTPLVNIFEELGHAIVTSNMNKNNENFVANIVFGKEYSKEELLLKADNLNYNLENPQTVFLIRFHDNINSKLNKISLNEFKINEFTSYITSLFESNDMNIIISSYGNNIIGLFSSNKGTNILNSIFNSFILDAAKKIPQLSITIGIGKTYNSASNIQKSFKEASKCMEIAAKLNKTNNILYYEELGILSLFFELDRKDLLKEFSNQVLGGLIDYDKKHKGELLKTVEVYLNNNCNIIKTSEELSTHRNTIKYRLKKVETICESSLNNHLFRVNIQNALLIHNFI